MHDRDEFHLEPRLHITCNVFNGEDNRVPGGEWGVHDDTEAFNLEISLVQGFKGASIIKVMVEKHGEVGVCDGGDKGGVFSRGWE